MYYCVPAALPPEEQASPHEEDTNTSTTKHDLEDSTSSGDVPKSKLEIRVKTKRLDLECPIAGPGRRRNVSPSLVAEEEEFIDLKVTVTDREKLGVKNDAFISYKVCTEVSDAYMYVTLSCNVSYCNGLFSLDKVNKPWITR